MVGCVLYLLVWLLRFPRVSLVSCVSRRARTAPTRGSQWDWWPTRIESNHKHCASVEHRETKRGKTGMGWDGRPHAASTVMAIVDCDTETATDHTQLTITYVYAWSDRWQITHLHTPPRSLRLNCSICPTFELSPTLRPFSPLISSSQLLVSD